VKVYRRRMSDTLLISELAARSGFTASTLRYYEQVGLLAAADRTPAGYRVYDQAALTRLRFIDRAKQLGLPLEEIRELVGIWGQGQCAHVQDKLRAHVMARSAQVRTRIEELAMFGAQLDAAQLDLDGQAPTGRCGDDCGCVPSAPASRRVPQPVEFTRARPIDGAAVGQGLVQTPVACTLTVADRPARLDEWNELLALAVDRTPVPGGLRLRFPPDPHVAGRLGDLAVREQACCSFFTFALHLAPDAVTLEVQAPEEALPVLADLFGIPA
jgi:DNA-binding transcriptional MerR regulator